MNRSFNDPSGLLNDQVPLSDSPDDVSPHDERTGGRGDARANPPRSYDTKTVNPAQTARAPAKAAASFDIAPWMSEGPATLNTYGFSSGGFLGDAQTKLDSTYPRPGTAQTGESDSPEPAFRNDERRPSITSATTVSSQNSWSKASVNKVGPNKKVAPFLSEDDGISSRTSDVSIPSTLHREQTNSSRHNSANTSFTDGGPVSPTSSRPLTPLPSSDVTPWLFQEFQVCLAFLEIQAISSDVAVVWPLGWELGKILDRMEGTIKH